MKANKIDKMLINKKMLGKEKVVSRRSILLVISLLLIILTINNISAIGITPGRTTLNFEPGLTKDVAFSVVNTEHKEMSVVIMIRGDLADYVTLSKVYEEFSSSDESKAFSYTISLPSKFEKPGLYEAEIVALEMPKGIKEQGAYVGATVAVISQIHVHVPYPNKYAEAEVNIIEADGKINFVIPVINRGKLDIVDLKALIDIYSLSGEKIVSLESNSASLDSLKRTELLAEWVPNVAPGRYKAVASVIYDNEVTTVEKEFNVGEMFLEILEVYVKDFQLGEIAKFNALVENKWSQDLEEVYLNILVYNEEGETMADFKSPTYDINALSKAEMVAYWDTAGVHIGTYDGKLLLKYGERSTERNIQLKISEDNIEIIGITGRVVVGGRGGLNLENILLIVVGVLVIANIIWFVLIRKLLKKRK